MTLSITPFLQNILPAMASPIMKGLDAGLAFLAIMAPQKTDVAADPCATIPTDDAVADKDLSHAINVPDAPLPVALAALPIVIKPLTAPARPDDSAKLDVDSVALFPHPVAAGSRGDEFVQDLPIPKTEAAPQVDVSALPVMPVGSLATMVADTKQPSDLLTRIEIGPPPATVVSPEVTLSPRLLPAKAPQGQGKAGLAHVFTADAAFPVALGDAAHPVGLKGGTNADEPIVGIAATPSPPTMPVVAQGAGFFANLPLVMAAFAPTQSDAAVAVAPPMMQSPALIYAHPATVVADAVSHKLPMPMPAEHGPIPGVSPPENPRPSAAERAFATRVSPHTVLQNAVLPVLISDFEMRAMPVILNTDQDLPTLQTASAHIVDGAVPNEELAVRPIPITPPAIVCDAPPLTTPATVQTITQPRPSDALQTPIMVTLPTPIPVVALAQTIASIAKSDTNQTVELRLDPVELGNIQLIMRGTEKDIVVVVMVERPETLDLLRKHADQFLSDLRQSGYAGTSLTFNLSDQQGHPQRHQSPAPFLDHDPLPPPPQPPRPMTHSSGLDMRL